LRRIGYRESIVLVDTGACYGGQLTAYCPETDATRQVDGVRLPSLQPARLTAIG
jgi:serine/threonine protein phosphatase 1